MQDEHDTIENVARRVLMETKIVLQENQENRYEQENQGDRNEFE